MPPRKDTTSGKDTTSDKDITSAKTKAQHLQDYVQQLSAMEKTVLQIAGEHLETSFSLEKSIGFKAWSATHNK